MFDMSVCQGKRVFTLEMVKFKHPGQEEPWWRVLNTNTEREEEKRGKTINSSSVSQYIPLYK